MDSITLENFRCFRERQTVRLAPLTLLVGENSTGKTSFLAMVRALDDLAFYGEVPSFKEQPYDLGSFDEIANHRGGRAGRASEFVAGFACSVRKNRFVNFMVTFRKQGPAPVPVRLKMEDGPVWTESIESIESIDSLIELHFGTSNGHWKCEVKEFESIRQQKYPLPVGLRFRFWYDIIESRQRKRKWSSVAGAPFPTKDDTSKAKDLLHSFPVWRQPGRSQLFANAPVRSRPHRTYDPAPLDPDPEGAYIPMLYADLHFRESDQWGRLKADLESFGKAAGLFDEIVVRPFGKRGTEPFQIQVRKFGERTGVKGPFRNLIDVGYGVSQVLPVITELLRRDHRGIRLLQQPEVHLHPSAQAALGSFFCQVAGSRRHQLIVETHSEYLLDRVRMDVRDGKCPLKPEEVSILFFEREGIDVKIHSLEFDKEGNVKNAPPGYGSFFMDEVSRSVRARPRESES